MQRFPPAVQLLSGELGIAHVLASRRRYTDFAERSDDPGRRCAQLVVRHGQLVFNEVVDQYLRRIEFADDGYAELVPFARLPGGDLDPARGFGQSIFGRGGARVEDALSMFWAGEFLADVAIDYRVPESQFEDPLRVATRYAA